MDFGKDLHWIGQTLHCNLSKSGQKGRHVILWSIILSEPILWMILKHEHLSERIIIFMGNYQLSLTSHAKTESLRTSRWGQRERESDEETCLDCRGYDVVVCFEAVHLHVNTQNLIRWVTKHISWTKWIERNHIVLVKLFFTMNLTNKHCRGSQTVYIMTQVFNLWLKHP